LAGGWQNFDTYPEPWNPPKDHLVGKSYVR